MTTSVRLTRGQLRARRQADFWSARRAIAPNTAAQAGVAFDEARARIALLPAGEQDAAWRALIAHLDAVAPDRSLHANFAPRAADFSGPTRTGARAGARRGHAHARTRARTTPIRSEGDR